MLSTMTPALLIAAVLAAIATSVPRTEAASGDTPAILRPFFEDLNRGDVDAVMGYFAADAIKVGGVKCFPTACFDPESIRADWMGHIAQGIQVTILDLERGGNVEMARVALTRDDFPPGVERMIAVVTAIMRGEQIVAWSALFDASDPQTAELLNLRWW